MDNKEDCSFEVLDQLREVWADLVDSCYVFTHPRYSIMGGKSMSIPLEWTRLDSKGRDNFVQWALWDRRKKSKTGTPLCVMIKPILMRINPNLPYNAQNCTLIDIATIIPVVDTVSRRYKYGRFTNALVVAVRRDAKSRAKPTPEALAKKYNATVNVITKILYRKNSVWADNEEPPLPRLIKEVA